MIRQTSLDAYHAIKNSGLLGEVQFTVFDFVFHNGPVTQKKAVRYFDDLNNTIGPRFAELEDMGILTTDGTELCEETNRQNLLWIATGNLPRDKVKKLSKKEKKQQLVTLITVLGKKLPEPERTELRAIYNLVTNL